MRLSILAAAAALSVASIATVQTSAQTSAPSQEPSGPKWDYVGKYGPLNWGKLDPSYKACSAGKEQSPIDIRGAHLNKALQPIEFHYMAGPVTLENNGHTVVAHVKPGSYIVADGTRYDLQQFHFHHPAEEAVKGKLSDMAVHFVHRSADGKLAVIAVRLNEDRGFPNAVLSALWPSLPKASGQTAEIKDMIDPGGLLPTGKGYWTYMGSLTTPPCTEGVHWFVYEQELSISRNQLRTFGVLFPLNSRPLQDPHGRKIEASE
jgi:carbonic anhydrase